MPLRSSSPLPREGEWLNGKYYLDRVLGEGGMAIVYEATHRNKKRFAIKILKREMASEHLVRRFLREGYVANTVAHPGAVSVLDDDLTEGGCPFLVMELLDGDSVETIAERYGGILPLQVVLIVAHQLLDTLVSAHAKNVVHRDLKPANLFITCDGDVKVLDFGIARLREEDVSTHDTANTGPPMGTPAFMAPEQARGKSSQVGPHTDLWAVGATMFSLLSDQTVHDGESAQELVFNSGAKPARSLSEVMPGVPKDVVEIVDRALSFEPKDRWGSATAMRDAIDTMYRVSYGSPVRTDVLVEQLGLEAYRVPSQQARASEPNVSVNVKASGRGFSDTHVDGGGGGGVAHTPSSRSNKNMAFARMTADPVSTDPAVKASLQKRRSRSIVMGIVALAAVVVLALAAVFVRPRIFGTAAAVHATGNSQTTTVNSTTTQATATPTTTTTTTTSAPTSIGEPAATPPGEVASASQPRPSSPLPRSPTTAVGRRKSAPDPSNKTRDWDRQ